MLKTINRHLLAVTLASMLIVALFLITRLDAATALMLLIAFLLFALATSSIMIIRKHRDAYLKGAITWTFFFRNVSLEIGGVLLAMLVAGICGRYLAQAVTRYISDDLINVLMRIVIGLLVGMVVGGFIQRASSRLVQGSPG